MNEKKKILVTGASGFLGSNFCNQYLDEYSIYAIWNKNPIEVPHINAYKTDITNKTELEKLIDKINPDTIIHLAAYSDPNQCQLHPAISEKINIEASENIAALCIQRGIGMVFSSTDLVFDGKSAPYKESDLPCPINTYGLHKSIAEQAIMDIFPAATICRLPLMYGPAPLITEPVISQSKSSSKIIPTRQNTSFLQPMLQKLQNNDQVSLFTDEYRTVASARDICRGLILCLQKPGEIFHFGGNERVSRFDFAQKVCVVYGYDKKLLVKSKQKDVSMPAPRPKDVSLSSEKTKSLGWQPGTIVDELIFIKSSTL
jgi:dTDP-4-dehydrorhamnose reductase